MSSSHLQPADRNLDHGVKTFLRANYAEACELPAPEEAPWTIVETDLSQSDICVMHGYHVIRVVGKRHVGRNEGESDTTHGWRNQYRTSPAAYEYIQSLDTPATPCGHTGVHCLEAGERYTCTNDDCSETFGRETARAEVER